MNSSRQKIFRHFIPCTSHWCDWLVGRFSQPLWLICSHNSSMPQTSSILNTLHQPNRFQSNLYVLLSILAFFYLPVSGFFFETHPRIFSSLLQPLHSAESSLHSCSLFTLQNLLFTRALIYTVVSGQWSCKLSTNEEFGPQARLEMYLSFSCALLYLFWCSLFVFCLVFS